MDLHEKGLETELEAENRGNRYNFSWRIRIRGALWHMASLFRSGHICYFRVKFSATGVRPLGQVRRRSARPGGRLGHAAAATVPGLSIQSLRWLSRLNFDPSRKGLRHRVRSRESRKSVQLVTENPNSRSTLAYGFSVEVIFDIFVPNFNFFLKNLNR